MPRKTHTSITGTGRVRALLCALACTVLLVMPAPPASAHAALETSNPVAGSTVTTVPPRVELVFNEDIDPKFAQIVLEDASGPRAADEVNVSGPSVSAPFPRDLAAGGVTLRYKVVSADGHPVSGSVAFTLAAGPSGAATSGTTTPPTGSATTSVASPAATSSGASTSGPATTSAPPVGDDSNNAMMFALMGLAAVVLVVVGVLLVRSDRRQRRAWRDPDARP